MYTTDMVNSLDWGKDDHESLPVDDNHCYDSVVKMKEVPSLSVKDNICYDSIGQLKKDAQSEEFV